MENPLSWGPAEKIVDQAITEAYENRSAGIFGLSLTRQVTDALRREGLLREQQYAHCATCDFPLGAVEMCSHCGAVTAVLCLSCHPRSEEDKALVAAMRNG